MPIIVESELPPGTTGEADVVFGIDEAGRGPLLGHMVYACAFWPLKDEQQIAAYGFDDSKALTHEQRTNLFDKMKACGLIGWMTHSLTAREIAAAMLHRHPISLNALSHDAAMSMLEAVLSRGVRVAKVFVDTVGDAGSYQRHLERHFNQGALGGGGTAGRGWAIDFVVCPKADSLYKCVSAASIAAKVERDRSMREWVFEEPALAHINPPTQGSASDGEAHVSEEGGNGSICAAQLMDEDEQSSEDDDIITPQTSKKARMSESAGTAPASKAKANSKEARQAVHEELMKKRLDKHPSAAGSGYPSDPLTKAWMMQHMDPVFGWPSVCRFSWKPAVEHLEAKGVKVTWPGDEGAGQPQAKMTSFFSSKASPAAVPKAWMRKKNIAPATNW